jgi:hypothetical protein
VRVLFFWVRRGRLHLSGILPDWHKRDVPENTDVPAAPIPARRWFVRRSPAEAKLRLGAETEAEGEDWRAQNRQSNQMY